MDRRSYLLSLLIKSTIGNGLTVFQFQVEGSDYDSECLNEFLNAKAQQVVTFSSQYFEYWYSSVSKLLNSGKDTIGPGDDDGNLLWVIIAKRSGEYKAS